MAKFRMKTMIDGLKPGSHVIRTLGGPDRTINAGEEIECDPELLKNVMHKFELLEPDKSPAPQPNVKLEMVKRPGGNLTGYDVINPATGEPINSKPLKKADAEELLTTGVVPAAESETEPPKEPESEDAE